MEMNAFPKQVVTDYLLKTKWGGGGGQEMP